MLHAVLHLAAQRMYAQRFDNGPKVELQIATTPEPHPASPVEPPVEALAWSFDQGGAVRAFSMPRQPRTAHREEAYLTAAEVK